MSDPMIEDDGYTEELMDLDNEINLAEQDCESIGAIEMSIESSGLVSRGVMEKLETLAPGCISEQYPLASYTESPSEQNLAISLEAIKWGKVFGNVAMLVILYAFIGKLFELLLTGRLFARREASVGAIIERHRKISSRLDKNAAKLKLNINEAMARTENDAPEPVKVLLNLMSPGSTAIKIMSSWVNKLDVRLNAYSDRMEVMIEVFKKAATADADEANKLADILRRERISPDDDFLKDVQQLKNIYAEHDAEKPSRQDLISSMIYLDYLYDKTAWRDVFEKELMPKKAAKIDKASERSGKVSDKLKDAAVAFSKKASKVKTTKKDNVITINASSRNADLEKEIDLMGKALKSEGSMIVYFYSKLNNSGKFYENAIGDMINFAKRVIKFNDTKAKDKE